MTCASRQLISPIVRSDRFERSLSILFFGPSAAWHIEPLQSEFADIFDGRSVNRFFHHIVEDIPCVSYCYSERDARIRLLKQLTVMPSEVIKRVAKRIGCPIKFPRPSLHISANRSVAESVARELNVDRQYVAVCWKTEVDLDAQWHALRRALLQMRRSSEVKA